METLKSSRFWIAVLICGAVTALACLRIITGDLAVGVMSGILGGFGVGKTWGGDGGAK